MKKDIDIEDENRTFHNHIGTPTGDIQKVKLLINGKIRQAN